VYGVLHDDKAHNLHFHLMISANKYNSNKRHRLDKSKFSDIKKKVEYYVLENFPELEQKSIINSKKERIVKNNKEYQLESRG